MNLKFSYLLSTALNTFNQYWKSLSLVCLGYIICSAFSNYYGPSSNIESSSFLREDGTFNFVQFASSFDPQSNLAFLSLLSIPLALFCDNFVVQVYNKDYDKTKLFSFDYNVLNLILGYILYATAVIIGSVLFFVPGLIFAIKFILFRNFIINENQGPIQALKSSWEATNEKSSTIFVNGILYAITCILFGIGLALISIAVFFFASTGGNLAVEIVFTVLFGFISNFLSILGVLMISKTYFEIKEEL
ncbi:MAG: hypothetical protein ACRCXZ_07020 [Patescibacteria group bacterium]